MEEGIYLSKGFPHFHFTLTVEGLGAKNTMTWDMSPETLDWTSSVLTKGRGISTLMDDVRDAVGASFESEENSI